MPHKSFILLLLALFLTNCSHAQVGDRKRLVGFGSFGNIFTNTSDPFRSAVGAFITIKKQKPSAFYMEGDIGYGFMRWSEDFTLDRHFVYGDLRLNYKASKYIQPFVGLSLTITVHEDCSISRSTYDCFSVDNGYLGIQPKIGFTIPFGNSETPHFSLSPYYSTGFLPLSSFASLHPVQSSDFLYYQNIGLRACWYFKKVLFPWNSKHDLK